MKILPPSTKPATFTPSSAVTVFEISEPTAVGKTIEVIEQDAAQPESRPLRARRGVVRLGQSDCGQNSILARKPKRSDASTLSRNGAITWRSGVTWHHGVTATL